MRISKLISVISCHTFTEASSPRSRRIFKNAFNMMSTHLWSLQRDFLGSNYQVVGPVSWKSVLVSVVDQIGLCHTFTEGKSRRWIRILKNAFNMVSGCPWYLQRDFLVSKYQFSDPISRNLAFRFSANPVEMSLWNKNALKTRSELIWTPHSGLSTWYRSIVHRMS